MAEKIVIERASVSTVSISGTTSQKKELRAKFFEVKSAASRFGGKILREEEFEDGFFLEVSFLNDSLKGVFEREIGLK